MRPAALCCPARYVRAYVRTPTYPCCVRALPGAYVRTYVRTPTYARTYVRTYVSFLRACSLPRTPHVYTYVRTYIRTRVVRSPIRARASPFATLTPRVRTHARAHTIRPSGTTKGEGQVHSDVVERNVRVRSHRIRTYVATVARALARYVRRTRAATRARAVARHVRRTHALCGSPPHQGDVAPRGLVPIRQAEGAAQPRAWQHGAAHPAANVPRS